MNYQNTSLERSTQNLLFRKDKKVAGLLEDPFLTQGLNPRLCALLILLKAAYVNWL